MAFVSDRSGFELTCWLIGSQTKVSFAYGRRSGRIVETVIVCSDVRRFGRALGHEWRDLSSSTRIRDRAGATSMSL